MDVGKINAYLNEEEFGNPLTDDVVMTIRNRLNSEKSEVGKLLRRLLEKAEEGLFK